MRLLVTRPEPDASRTAAALKGLGHEVITQPLLRIEPILDADFGSGPWAAVAMTSANAADAFARHPGKTRLSALPAFTVGSRTREAALAAGFSKVESADGDVEDLARLIATKLAGSGKPLIYIAGEDRAGDLEGRLRARDIAVHTVIVYRAVTENRFSADFEAAVSSGSVDGVLHYSSRSAGAFVTSAKNSGLIERCLALQHFCLSAAVAAPLAAVGAQHIHIATRPDQSALFDLLNQV